MTDVENMKRKGFMAEYLQCGYDHKYYFQKQQKRYNTIGFCANYYAGCFGSRNIQNPIMEYVFSGAFMGGSYRNDNNFSGLQTYNSRTATPIINPFLNSYNFGTNLVYSDHDRNFSRIRFGGLKLENFTWMHYGNDWYDVAMGLALLADPQGNRMGFSINQTFGSNSIMYSHDEFIVTDEKGYLVSRNPLNMGYSTFSFNLGFNQMNTVDITCAKSGGNNSNLWMTSINQGIGQDESNEFTGVKSKWNWGLGTSSINY
jgi:hypothetical protein